MRLPDSQCALAPGGSNSPLKRRSKTTAVSQPSKTNRTPQSSSASGGRRSKSSAMSWDSMDDASVIEWASSLPVSPVHLSLSLAVEPGETMSAGFGRRLPEPFGRFVPGMSGLRTYQVSLWNTKNNQQELTRFSGTWPKAGIVLHGSAYELPTWAPVTSGPECLSSQWTTPQSHDSQHGRFGTQHGGANLADDVLFWMTPTTPSGGRTISEADVIAKGKTNRGKRTVGLENQAEFWSTITATDANGRSYTRDSGQKGKERLSLTGEAEMWPSPAARDHRDPNALSYQERSDSTKGEQLVNFVAHSFSLPVPTIHFGLTFSQRVRFYLRLCRLLRERLPSPYNKVSTLFRKKLNPDFVDWLMAWPVGWSSEGRDFSEAEMALYQHKQRWLLSCLLGGCK